MPKTIALEMEKLCHAEDEEKTATITNLTHCLRDHVEPSIEVLNAIKEVESSYAKTYVEKVTIGIQLFISSFLMPFSVMVSDMSLDIILVVGYAAFLFQLDDTVHPIGLQDVCGHYPNSTTYSNELTNLLRLEKDIPSKLTGRPRFFYSSAFIVLPWIFYIIEFCHSRHLRNTIKKV